jgi:hypothetical protein
VSDRKLRYPRPQGGRDALQDALKKQAHGSLARRPSNPQAMQNHNRLAQSSFIGFGIIAWRSKKLGIGTAL